MKNKKILLTPLLILLLGFLFYIFYFLFTPKFGKKEFSQNIVPPINQEIKKNEREILPEESKKEEIIVQDLNTPWEMVFLPEGDILITERQGILKRRGEINEDYQIEGVYQIGEGGLLGLALHPDFEKNRYLYLYFTYQQGESIKNKVERFFYTLDRKLKDKKVIIDNIPAAVFHNGGRIIFGPDKHLYITTGDALEAKLAQDLKSLAGKILRLKDDGTIPKDNPFKNAIWSFGHRNPQGLVFDDKGRLWATEHGASGNDEINLIEKGKNYGWPEIQGDQEKAGMEKPIIHSGKETWAPASLVWQNNSLFFVGLRGKSLYRVDFDSDGRVKEIKNYFKDEFGRLRILKVGPDNFFYLGTSNRDGRGIPRENDDKIIKLRILNNEE
jgi:glucose/arabinose dehydrogenase